MSLFGQISVTSSVYLRLLYEGVVCLCQTAAAHLGMCVGTMSCHDTAAEERPVSTLHSMRREKLRNYSLTPFSKLLNNKQRGKVHPITGHEGPYGEYRYSSTLSLTSELDGVGGQRQAPATLPPEKTRYPLYRRLGGPQSQSGRVRKISPPPGFDPWTVQPVASRYSDYAF
jgi:hypothetical protein